MNLLQITNNKTSQSEQACKSLFNSGFGSSGNQLLAAANANNAENAGVRCANTNNRGANTNANYGFPCYAYTVFPFAAMLQNEIQNNQTAVTLPHKNRCAAGVYLTRCRYTLMKPACRQKNMR